MKTERLILPRRSLIRGAVKGVIGLGAAASLLTLAGCPGPRKKKTHVVRLAVDESDPNNPKIADDFTQHVLPKGTEEVIFVSTSEHWCFRFADANDENEPSPLVWVDGEEPKWEIKSSDEDWWFRTDKLPKKGGMLHFRVILERCKPAGPASEKVIRLPGSAGGGGTLVEN